MAEATRVIETEQPRASKPKTKRLVKAARAQQLLDIAEDLFTTQGFDATSIEDIARAAGVTRPIIYEHFGSLEGVLLACVQRAQHEYQRSLAEAVHAAESTDPGEMVERGSQVFFALLERDPRRWAMLFSSTTALSNGLAEKLADLRFATVDLIADFVRPYAPHAPEELVHAVAHAISGVAMQMGYWWLRNPAIPRERIIAYYRDFIIGGINNLIASGAAAFQTTSHGSHTTTT